jgi:hypothetical protein
MSTWANLSDHDVFLLKAMVEELTVFGFRVSRKESFRKCEVFLPGGSSVGRGGRPAGELVCFIERDFGQDICFYSDATKMTELLRVKGQPRLVRTGQWRRTVNDALHAVARGRTYDVTEADGTRIGVIHKSLGERRYDVSDTAGTGPMFFMLEGAPATLKEWGLSARPFSNDRFAIWRDEHRLGWHEPSRSRTDSTINLTPACEHIVDRRLVLAVSCLDLLRIREDLS